MKTTLLYAACAVSFALFTFPARMHAASSASYVVNFNANGGQGNMASQTFAVDKSANLAANRFTRGGYVFYGWATSSSGAVSYQNGQSVKNLAKGGKTVTLYAKWAVQNYIVAFYANGGSGSMPLQRHTYGKAANLLPNQFTRKGYSFAGWATTPQGPLKFKDKESVKNLTQAGRTIQLFALWKASAAALPGDQVDFSQLKWSYGGFDGASAKISAKARVTGLKASNSGLTYSWASGGCQNLGASSASDASCLACLFCYTGGKWVGGKFDWICTNDRSPSFGNVIGNYKGWSSAALSKATEYAFVILSKDGKSRTNVIRVKSPGFSAATTAQSSSATTSATTALPGDQVDFSQLKWSYGGFDGASAKISAKARVTGLKASNSGLTYSWASGGCQNLGASSASDASCLACLFCYTGGKWVGGKFDWICTNDRSPSFGNVIGNYKGWSSAALSKATEYAFVILSKDGKSRTNVIRVKSPGFSATTTASAASSAVDEVNFSLLQWSYGGFKGGDAKLGSQPRISNLKVSGGGMSYSWASGGCENLGAASSTEASCLACLFCHYDGKWIGGKFDWISTSRRTRDFENIESGYNGWSPAVFSRADAYAFVIVSRDGKTRSNVIRCGK